MPSLEDIAPVADAAGKWDEYVSLSASLPAATRIAPHDIRFASAVVGQQVSP
jgi:hypothetical protein